MKAATARLRLRPAQARAVVVAAQGLDRRPRRTARPPDVLDAIRNMGALQIDTIHVVARSPYLVLWSRLGAFDHEWLEQLLAQGSLFEYWSHEACFLPIEDYPLYRHRMIDPGSMGWKYSHEWIAKHRHHVELVLAAIRENGPVRSADFKRNGQQKRSGGWWSWKPEKRALEMLFTSGDLMIARREKFQRVYDLRERVLPAWDDAELIRRDEAERALALRAVAALGVTPARWVADYFRSGSAARGRGTGSRETVAHVHALAAEGELLTVDVDGSAEPWYAHRSRLELVERAAAGRLRPRLTTLLSPFDPLVWHRARASELFGFDYRLECYTPAPKRRYGYFVLPILRRGRLIGRLDAKAHRRQQRMEIHRLFLESGVRPNEELIADVAATLREFAQWHGTPAVVLRRTEPAALRAPLMRAIGRS